MATTTPEEITQATIASFSGTPDARLKQIVEALTRHLHDFVSEMEPTQAEWVQAIAFLTRVGHMCQGARQEFILLSDVLGVSMLVDAINHGESELATESTVLGPFYVDQPPAAPLGADIADGQSGPPMWVDARITDEAGAPVAGATVDVWQCDDEGLYDIQRDMNDGQYSLRARFTSDAQGLVRFWSIVPIAYQIPSDGPVGDLLAATGRHPWRPAHIHFKIAADGFVPLVTHLFVSGDQYLGSDAVFGVKPSLIAELPPHDPAQAPPGRAVDRAWQSLERDFVLRRDERASGA